MLTPIRTTSWTPSRVWKSVFSCPDLEQQVGRGAHRPQRVVLMKRGNPEYSDHGIPDELLHSPTVPLHHRPSATPVPGQHPPQHLGVHRRPQHRRVHQVTKQDRHRLTLARTRFRQRSRTGPTEVEPLRVFGAARETSHHLSQTTRPPSRCQKTSSVGSRYAHILAGSRAASRSRSSNVSGFRDTPKSRVWWRETLRLGLDRLRLREVRRLRRRTGEGRVERRSQPGGTVAMSAECRQHTPGCRWTSEDADGCGWACDLRGRSLHHGPAPSTTARWRRMLLRLTRRVTGADV